MLTYNYPVQIFFKPLLNCSYLLHTRNFTLQVGKWCHSWVCTSACVFIKWLVYEQELYFHARLKITVCICKSISSWPRLDSTLITLTHEASKIVHASSERSAWELSFCLLDYADIYVRLDLAGEQMSSSVFHLGLCVCIIKFEAFYICFAFLIIKEIFTSKRNK